LELNLLLSLPNEIVLAREFQDQNKQLIFFFFLKTLLKFYIIYNTQKKNHGIYIYNYGDLVIFSTVELGSEVPTASLSSPMATPASLASRPSLASVWVASLLILSI
jgi:hypothetical protein